MATDLPSSVNATVAISVRYRIRFFKRRGTNMVRLTMWVNGSRKKTHNDFEASPRIMRGISKLLAEQQP